ncbi:CinA family protein [Microbacterium sp. SSW1-49]|uniref:CinA family protein n=1 Tax=Microbacterium croceum TaxID=2851645 RepID=A0ABT0FEN4_9MICO|nr:CinA family protein [Microbacterium croceum]MCK2036530.1 CinA family protein [Microbacterium croceum]
MTSSAAVVLDALARRGWTLGVAESLTGGSVSAALVEVPGASAVLWGGVVAYATPIKHSLLGVDAELLERHGPVHPTVALQMAEGVRRAVSIDGLAADVGISTTGIAGPDSPDGQPVGTVHVGVVTPEASRTAAFLFDGNRAQIRSATVDVVLRTLWDVLGE